MPVKTYVTSAVADMLRQRRGDVSEAKFVRNVLHEFLGVKEGS